MRGLFALALALATGPLPAFAQPDCPSGIALSQQTDTSDRAFTSAAPDIQFGRVPSTLSKRTRALAYLMFDGAGSDAALEALPRIISISRPCHADDCPPGIDLTEEERTAVKETMSRTLKAITSGAPSPVWAPVLRPIPTPERVAWAESVLGCKVSLTASAPAPAVTYNAPRPTPPAPEPVPAPAPEPARRVERVYGDWAYGQGYYCENNTYQTDLYAKANAREACRNLGGYDGGTYIANSGYNAYRPNAEQCYQAKAYTDCVLD
ncbi:MAG: hypothetical protein KDA53_11385 [Hyphomonas sp.]|nr:hypothetical protein [Hyphomonas sp.]